jgi:serine/threonine protein kinase
MEESSEAFVLHLFKCLAAHHRVDVLLGDIKPGNMFGDHSLRPVFGDYGHATVFDKSGKRALHLGRIQPNPKAAARLQYRTPQPTTGRLSTHMQEVLSSADSSTKAVAPASAAAALRLVGTCSAIGTTGYRALETTILVPGLRGAGGVYTKRSDVYWLAVSLIELLVGYTAQTSRNPARQQAATLTLQRRTHLLAQCDQLLQFSQLQSTNPYTKQEWLKQGALARVPVPLIELLRQLIEPPRMIDIYR